MPINIHFGIKTRMEYYHEINTIIRNKLKAIVT